MADTDPTHPDAPAEATPPRLPWHARAPWLTMALNMLLIVTIFLTRDRWAAWVVAGELPECAAVLTEANADTTRALLFTGDEAILWDLEEMTCVARYETACWESYAFTPRGDRFHIIPIPGDAEPSREPMQVVDSATGKTLSRIDEGTGLRGMLFSPDASAILLTYSNTGNRIVDTASGETLICAPPSDGWYLVTFSLDGRRLLTTHLEEEEHLRVWDIASGQELYRIEGADIEDARFSDDGQTVMILYEFHDEDYVPLKSKCRVVDANSGRTVREMDDLPFGTAFTPSGALVHPVANINSASCILRLWDAQSGRKTAEIKLHSMVAVDISFDRSGRYALARCARNRFAAVDVVTGQRYWPAAGTDYYPIALAPDGERVFMADEKGNLLEDETRRSLVVVSAETDGVLTTIPDCFGFSLLGDDLLAVDRGAKQYLLRRIRPEQWWGIFWLPNLYLIAALAVALVISGWRDLKRLRAL
ncbi:MAG: WD40 repeat domain-containing protein [Planctomycetota bacterium]